MKKKIYKFLDNEKKFVTPLAKELIEVFKTEANDENTDYSFTIGGESKKISNEEANTYFYFDTTGQTILHDFKKALFDKDLKNIKEDSPEEKELMEDVRNFLLKVCGIITKEYSEDLEETIRRVILGNKYSKETVPLSTIEVRSIDIADYSSVPESSKYLLKIGKVPGSDINTDDVIIFIQNRQEKTGMDIDNIFSIEKRAGNPLFKNVVAVQKGRKFLNEIAIYFFVDYSIINREEKLKIVKEEQPEA